MAWPASRRATGSAASPRRGIAGRRRRRASAARDGGSLRHRTGPPGAGRHLPPRTGARRRPLAPTGEPAGSPPTTDREVNDTSIVLAISLGPQQRVLLTGDLEDDRDARAACCHADARRPRWDLLKVAHHGSATASSGALLVGPAATPGGHQRRRRQRLRPSGAGPLAATRGGRRHRLAHRSAGHALGGLRRAAEHAAPLDGPRCPVARGAGYGPSDLGGLLRSARWRCPREPRPSPCSLSTRPSQRLLQHVTVVAEVASFLAHPRPARRPGGGPPPRRDSRAPPRHRQGAARRRPPARARPRPRGRGVAQRRPATPSWHAPVAAPSGHAARRA